MGRWSILSCVGMTSQRAALEEKLQNLHPDGNTEKPRVCTGEFRGEIDQKKPTEVAVCHLLPLSRQSGGL